MVQNCAILDTRNMELLLKMPGMLNYFFVMIWIKEVKRTHDHCTCIFFDLGSDWDFLNIDSVFNNGERSEPEKFAYKKQPLDPPLLPIKPPHWTPTLTNLRGVSRPCPPMLERKACAQFYMDKNMWRNAARDRVLLNHFNNSGVTYTCILFIAKRLKYCHFFKR